MTQPTTLNRRSFAVGLAVSLAAPFVSRHASAQTRRATPSCGSEPLTPSQTVGPFFSSGSPRRRSLTADAPGTVIALSGTVMDRGCRPIAAAKLDFWQADAAGAYDNRGFRLRGHQFTDREGRWVLETILPGLYPGRTRHIHVRVQPRGGAILTTQLYFPGEPQNVRDGLYNPELLVALARGGRRGRFDFVLA